MANKKQIVNKKKLDKIIQEENDNWNAIFEKEIKKRFKSQKKFSSFWWKLYYDEIIDFVLKKIGKSSKNTILEAGSGSGKASLLLNRKLDLTLLDISKEALKYAKLLAEDYGCKNVKFIEGNIFDLKFKSSTFDLVWNIGVLEHYNKKEIKMILSEMIRVTKKDGLIMFGVPNKRSGPIIKAKLLELPLFKYIPGYRLGTEKFYSEEILIKLLRNELKKISKLDPKIEVQYFGNPLPMESPKWLINSFGKLLSFLFYKRKFLMMICARKQ